MNGKELLTAAASHSIPPFSIDDGMLYPVTLTEWRFFYSCCCNLALIHSLSLVIRSILPFYPATLYRTTLAWFSSVFAYLNTFVQGTENIMQYTATFA